MNGEPNYVYIVLSATPYRMGRWIRRATGEAYNHVSIATEESLTTLYSFARRYYRTPFHGGFVTETPDRYHHKGLSSHIRLYRLPVARHRYRKLLDELEQMQSHSSHYLYNHLSVLAAPAHKKVAVKDAYTCAEFVVSILSSLGYGFDPEQYYSVGDIARPLEDYCIYEGDFPAQGLGDPEFFQRHPVNHPALVSARGLLQLCWRLAVSNFLDSRIRKDFVR